MKPVILCYPQCGTCRKAEHWLRANEIEYTYRPIKEDHPSKDEIADWIKKSGLPIRKFFNTSGMLYKEYNMKEKVKNLSDEELIGILAENGLMVKRPILLVDSNVLVGFQEESYKQIFGK